ncbi:hypothetical protein RRG08_062027 [Elysia crispata]|uniref:Uncharacterized protein n=1 Tax=Elysia crispata TaxID=231223 RepID=A0AAE1DRI8_9GAST|nr:hypothetical protein RRG08_062027 [Elysia crispata]
MPARCPRESILKTKPKNLGSSFRNPRVSLSSSPPPPPAPPTLTFPNYTLSSSEIGPCRSKLKNLRIASIFYFPRASQELRTKGSRPSAGHKDRPEGL